MNNTRFKTYENFGCKTYTMFFDLEGVEWIRCHIFGGFEFLKYNEDLRKFEWHGYVKCNQDLNIIDSHEYYLKNRISESRVPLDKARSFAINITK